MTRSATELTDRRGQLRRADKIMTAEEVDAFLEGAFCGRTATIGADGYPAWMCILRQLCRFRNLAIDFFSFFQPIRMALSKISPQ